ncbi:MAG: molybdopterin-binding protein [Bacillota bacterium]|nr:molybdopterin-binding protein [Bacillota bacterium]MDI7249107.1 molybdopterin-binding protein [Bacillota bacterium]
MRSREVPIREAVGMPLAYDLTEIVPGQRKGAVLRRGHVVTEVDLEVLRRIGKSHLRVLELEPGEVHEDDAARRLARVLAGPGVEVSMPGEAWADLRASRTGLLKVDAARLLWVNLVEELLVAARQDNSPVKEGEVVARAKVRGLAVREEVLQEAERIAAGQPVIWVLPFREVRAGAVITGREVYEGRVKDAFEPLLRSRLEEYGGMLVYVKIVPDEAAEVSRAITWVLSKGVDMVLVTGGMSPDDSTVEGIGRSGAEVVFHGVPVSPGAMGVLAYAGEAPVVGVPAGLLARPRGFFDLVLPRLLAGERLSREDVARYGHGGLCWGCAVCVFPACPFGKAG